MALNLSHRNSQTSLNHITSHTINRLYTTHNPTDWLRSSIDTSSGAFRNILSVVHTSLKKWMSYWSTSAVLPRRTQLALLSSCLGGGYDQLGMLTSIFFCLGGEQMSTSLERWTSRRSSWQKEDGYAEKSSPEEDTADPVQMDRQAAFSSKRNLSTLQASPGGKGSQ